MADSVYESVEDELVCKARTLVNVLTQGDDGEGLAVRFLSEVAALEDSFHITEEELKTLKEDNDKLNKSLDREFRQRQQAEERCLSLDLTLEEARREIEQLQAELCSAEAQRKEMLKEKQDRGSQLMAEIKILQDKINMINEPCRVHSTTTQTEEASTQVIGKNSFVQEKIRKIETTLKTFSSENNLCCRENSQLPQENACRSKQQKGSYSVERSSEISKEDEYNTCCDIRHLWSPQKPLVDKSEFPQPPTKTSDLTTTPEVKEHPDVPKLNHENQDVTLTYYFRETPKRLSTRVKVKTFDFNSIFESENPAFSKASGIDDALEACSVHHRVTRPRDELPRSIDQEILAVDPNNFDLHEGFRIENHKTTSRNVSQRVHLREKCRQTNSNTTVQLDSLKYPSPNVDDEPSTKYSKNRVTGCENTICQGSGNLRIDDRSLTALLETSRIKNSKEMVNNQMVKLEKEIAQLRQAKQKLQELHRIFNELSPTNFVEGSRVHRNNQVKKPWNGQGEGEGSRPKCVLVFNDTWELQQPRGTKVSCAVCVEDVVWICSSSDKGSTMRVVNLVDGALVRHFQCSASSPVLCMASSADGKVWLGCDDGTLQLHETEECRAVALDSSVLCLAAGDRNIAAGLASGSLAVFHPGKAGGWNLGISLLVKLAASPITCLTTLDNTALLAGSSDTVHVLHPTDFAIKDSHVIRAGVVSHIAATGQWVWIALKERKTLQLHEADTFKQVQVFDVGQYLTQALNSSTQDLEITALAVFQNSILWVGTSMGSILHGPLTSRGTINPTDLGLAQHSNQWHTVLFFQVPKHIVALQVSGSYGTSSSRASAHFNMGGDDQPEDVHIFAWRLVT